VAAFGVGVAGSVAVALDAGVHSVQVAVIIGLTAAGGLAVAAAGLAVEVWLRRRRLAVARLSLLTAVVTAAAVLVALAAVARGMLVNQHDLAVVLAALPVAVGTGALYGVLSGRRAAADLEALAALARQLDAPRRPWARVRGPAEVQAVAGALVQAAARLADARRREREVEASRRDLVAWASHDLRTPLTSLRAAAEALADDMAPDEATRRRYLASLSAHVERLSRLVDDLFELSQIDAGALALRLEPTDLLDLIVEVADRFAPGAEAVGVRLDLQVPEQLGVVCVGREQIGRVLANLVANGIRHTPPGGRVLISAEGTGEAALMRVADSCGGIPEAALPRVFDPMWRGDPARAGEGAGLGLAIARGLVEAHGGWIEVANASGGCQFTIRIPRRPAGGPAARTQPQGW
jgi:signal transduction histidine kinase